MPFCPSCKYEYEPQVARCPDCDLELVADLPHTQVETTRDVRFVPLPDLPGRVYADMVKTTLDEMGIPCYLRSDGLMDTIGVTGTGPMNRGVRIFVPEDRVDECLSIQHQMMDHI
jgi:hypothetical protein